MTIKLIGMKDFRQNLASYTEEAQKHSVCFIILKKNVPVLEIKPIDEKKFALEKLAEEIKQARTQVKKGDIHSQEEIMKEFGIL